MSQEAMLNSEALANVLLDIVPKVFMRVRADVPFVFKQSITDPDLLDVAELKVTSSQFALLQILVERERCMMQELAEYLAVAPSTVTAMIKRLLAQHYVERGRDDADWRSVWIKPTELGRRVAAAYNSARRISLYCRLEQLSEDERQKLAAALPALRRLLEI